MVLVLTLLLLYFKGWKYFIDSLFEVIKSGDALSCLNCHRLQIGALEDVRGKTLRGALEIQKCFRRHLAHRSILKLKGGSTALQSCKPYLLDHHD